MIIIVFTKHQIHLDRNPTACGKGAKMNIMSHWHHKTSFPNIYKVRLICLRNLSRSHRPRQTADFLLTLSKRHSAQGVIMMNIICRLTISCISLTQVITTSSLDTPHTLASSSLFSSQMSGKVSGVEEDTPRLSVFPILLVRFQYLPCSVLMPSLGTICLLIYLAQRTTISSDRSSWGRLTVSNSLDLSLFWYL